MPSYRVCGLRPDARVVAASQADGPQRAHGVLRTALGRRPKPALRRTHAPRRHVCREEGSPSSNGDPAQAPMQRNVAQTWVETVAVLMASSSRIAASSLMATWKPLRALPGQPSNLAAASGAPPLCPCLDNICTSLHHARWRSGVSGTSTVRPEGHGSFCACVGTLCGRSRPAVCAPGSRLTHRFILNALNGTS